VTAAAAAAQDHAETGRKLFAGPCTFIWGADSIDSLPPMGPPEIAFAGRSNVGKSSLLNALTNRTTLARTSHTPGRTQQLNFFALGADPPEEPLRLIDMPGYGYAAVSRQKVANWTGLMRAYLRGRASLVRVFVLVDARHGLKDLDAEMFDLLDGAAISYEVVLTKSDALKPAEREARCAATLAGLARRPAAYPEVIATSARTGEGIPALRAAVAALLAGRGMGGPGRPAAR
jgi:GTP-binding protein